MKANTMYVLVFLTCFISPTLAVFVILYYLCYPKEDKKSTRCNF